MTASKFRAVLHTKIDEPSISLIKEVCYPASGRKYLTAAMQWGIQHEKDAIKAYVSMQKRDGHDNVIVAKSGFYVSSSHPFVGASPDSFVSCCCGEGLVEVKCPAVSESSTLREKALQGSFRLEIHEDQLRLKKDHAYYFQCQLQLFTTEREFCDCCVDDDGALLPESTSGCHFYVVQVKGKELKYLRTRLIHHPAY